MSDLASMKTAGGHHFDKYRSGNPFIRLLVGGYLDAVTAFVREAEPESVVDVGCGEGYVMRHLKGAGVKAHFTGFDVSYRILEGDARPRNRGGAFACASASALPVDDSSFDLVLLCEVLEHLSDPDGALIEARRVSRRFVLVTVPNEPYWRIANVLRLRYLSDFGNTPGHIHHYTKKKLEELLMGHFRRVRMMCSTIWIIALCEV